MRARAPAEPRAAPKIRRTTTAITIRSATIWIVTTARAACETGAMSPRPTVENSVTAKYSAAVRLSGSENA